MQDWGVAGHSPASGGLFIRAIRRMARMKSPVSKSNAQVEALCAKDDAYLILRTEDGAYLRSK